MHVEASKLAFQNANSPVAFFVNGLGDHILNLPALRALAALFEDHLILLCVEGSHEFIFDELRLRRRIAFRTHITRRSIEFDADALTREIGLCDLFISLVPWLSDSLTRLVDNLAPHRSVGFFPNYKTVAPLDDTKHTSRLSFDLVRKLAPEYRFEDFLDPIHYPGSDLATARSLRASLSPRPNVLVVHPDTSTEKMWEIDKLAATLNAFLARHDDFVALLVGWTARSLSRQPHDDRIIPCYGLPLVLTWCLVADANLFLGVDSCMLHAADFGRVPAVGLFGPTRAERFGFLVGPNITIQAHGRMDMIHEGLVIQALESLLSDQQQSTLWTVEGHSC